MELLFFGIGKCRVGFQRKRTRIPDHGKLLIRKKALFVYQACTGSKIQLRGFIERTEEQEESLNMRKSETYRNEIKSYIVRTA